MSAWLIPKADQTEAASPGTTIVSTPSEPA